MNTQKNNFQPPGSFKEWIIDLYYQSIPLVTINLVWLPLTLMLVTAPPAAAGLFYAAHELVHGNQAGWNTFFEGFRKYFWLSWAWFLLAVGGSLFFLTNIWIYWRMQSQWAIFPLFLSVIIAVLWIVINLYSFPMLLHQEEKKIFQSLRNSLVIVLRRPIATLKLILLIVLVIAISFPIPVLFVFLTGSLTAYLCSLETKNAVERLIPTEDTGE